MVSETHMKLHVKLSKLVPKIGRTADKEDKINLLTIK